MLLIFLRNFRLKNAILINKLHVYKDCENNRLVNNIWHV